MLCLVCDTPILERDNFFWRFNTKSIDQSDGGVHDDCLIRAYEFGGDHDKAKKFYDESEILYKTIKALPKA